MNEHSKLEVGDLVEHTDTTELYIVIKLNEWPLPGQFGAPPLMLRLERYHSIELYGIESCSYFADFFPSCFSRYQHISTTNKEIDVI